MASALIFYGTFELSHDHSVNLHLEGLLPRRYQRGGVEAEPVEVRRDDAVRARRARRAFVVRFAIRVRGRGIRIGRVNHIRRVARTSQVGFFCRKSSASTTEIVVAVSA